MPTIDLKLQVTSKIISRYKALVKKAVEKMELEVIREHLSDTESQEFDNLVSEMTNRAITPRN